MSLPIVDVEVLRKILREERQQYSNPPDVHFLKRYTPPPPAQYIGPDDFLQTVVFTTSATSGLVLDYKILDADGVLHYGHEILDTSSLSTLVTKVFRLTEGWLIGLNISNIGGGLADQVCFVAAGLQRSDGSARSMHTILCQNYVTNLFSVVWPPTMPRGPATSASSVIAKPLLDSWVDNPPASPTTWDDEFDAGALDAKWTWENQGTATATFASSNLKMAQPTPGASTDDIRLIRQAVPGAAPWTFTCKCQPAWYPQTFNRAGIMVKDATLARYLAICPSTFNTPTAGNTLLLVDYWSAVNTLSTHLWGTNPDKLDPTPYLAIQYDGTNLKFMASADGVNFWTAFSELATTHLTNGPGFIGLFVSPLEQTSQPIAADFDWFRRTQ